MKETSARQKNLLSPILKLANNQEVIIDPTDVINMTIIGLKECINSSMDTYYKYKESEDYYKYKECEDFFLEIGSSANIECASSLGKIEGTVFDLIKNHGIISIGISVGRNENPEYWVNVPNKYFLREYMRKNHKVEITDKGNLIITPERECEVVSIRYTDEKLLKLEYIEGKSDWIDLRAAEDVKLKAGDHRLISLGVAMKIPRGFEAHIVPRSSTLTNFGVIQGNHLGVVDQKFCGNDDIWKFSAYALRDTEIKFNDRICQFRIVKNQPEIIFDEREKLEGPNRGGFGTTGKR